MYEVALSVGVCLRSGTHADVAWIVADEGFPLRNKGEALVVTPGGGKIGKLLDSAVNDQVAALVSEGLTRRLLDVTVDEIGALIAGLPSGGTLRCLVAPAEDFPETMWDDLWSGQPVCLITRLDGNQITGIEVYGSDQAAGLDDAAAALFRGGVTDSLIEPDRIVTALWPVPRLAIVGGGPLCEALDAAARPLGWQPLRFMTAAEASPLLMGFGALDLVVVASHDLDTAGSSLGAALSGSAGYIGALGSAEMNQARLDWLTMRGVHGLERIYGPAGLDIGAARPAEVAIAVLAEALAVRAGRTPRSLRDAVTA